MSRDPGYTVASSRKMLTIPEVADLSGISRTTIGNAVRAGRIEAKKQIVDGRPQWVLYRASLRAYLKKFRPQTDTRWTNPWSEADIAALLELSTYCTDLQIAEYLGRTAYSVRRKLERLRQKGVAPDINRGSGPVRSTPWMVPRTGILLAKTCLKCGKLLDAASYRLDTKTLGPDGVWRDCHKYVGTCRPCEYANERGRRPKRRFEHEKLKQAQLASQAGAVRTYQPYTDAEVKLIMDPSRSVEELAKLLGRTVYGIKTARGRRGFKSNSRPRRGSEWRIDFPAARDAAVAAAAQEKFRELGVVPESEWEWDDDVA